MPTFRIDDEPDQEKRIEKLRDEVRKLGGTFSAEVEVPPDLEEEFLKHVLEYEYAQPITLLQLLKNAGLDVPAPHDLGLKTGRMIRCHRAKSPHILVI